MQRQSLGGGSPGSKLHLQGVGVGGKDDKKLLIEDEQQQNRKDMVGVALEEDEEEKKKMIDHNRSSLTFRAEKSIHLIPILILFCLLVLYLCSYDPPPKDLIHINGFIRPSKKIGIKCRLLNLFV
ncbi:hypothetical protein AQUCO_00500540v1 [Aquilegia coerulea]|uniref:Uncharacterized protein n=1 Tax=Aquilegia coerulea TaxID=218851 RepID=A0A2G5ESF2_AQUCA|nr:hypothetical protein AQUCO_00500540v1 [Aquilegia coerulea]